MTQQATKVLKEGLIYLHCLFLKMLFYLSSEACN